MFAEVGAAIAKARGGEEGSGDDPLGPPDEGGRELSPPEARWLDEEEARQDSL
jgi:hypothetical protein